jgi:hypothetical protein
VISDPTIAKHILRDNPKAYDKGVLAEILEPIMGKGLIPADPETWKVRRRAIVPGFHKAWLNAMVRKFYRSLSFIQLILIMIMFGVVKDGSFCEMQRTFGRKTQKSC